MTDPSVTCCSIGTGKTVREAVQEALEKFASKLHDEYPEYYFSAARVEITTYREGLFRRTHVCELWYSRHPRTEAD